MSVANDQVFRGDATCATCTFFTWLHPTHGQLGGLPLFWSGVISFLDGPNPYQSDLAFSRVLPTPTMAMDTHCLYTVAGVNSVSLDEFRTIADTTIDTAFLVFLAWENRREQTFAVTMEVVGAADRTAAVHEVEEIRRQNGGVGASLDLVCYSTMSLAEFESTVEDQREQYRASSFGKQQLGQCL